MNEEFKNVMETTGEETQKPFQVIETTDAFREPYAIWDSWRKHLLIEADGTVPTFLTSQEAQAYCLRLLIRNQEQHTNITQQ